MVRLPLQCVLWGCLLTAFAASVLDDFYLSAEEVATEISRSLQIAQFCF
uniref:CD40 molecule n=1 Tax=Homo sapiens TaxID=9606 RepID=A0A8Q3WKP7_HUMAN